MYAIVRSGGRQHKVAVGDVIEIDRTAAGPGDSLRLPAVLLVDGDTVTAEADKLAKVAVTAEVVDNTLGPKLRIFKYKNKTGYRKRQGHRQRYTRVKVIDIKGRGTSKTESKVDSEGESTTGSKTGSKTDSKTDSKTES